MSPTPHVPCPSLDSAMPGTEPPQVFPGYIKVWMTAELGSTQACRFPWTRTTNPSVTRATGSLASLGKWAEDLT